MQAGRGFGGGESPSSGASRHLLPARGAKGDGEKGDGGWPLAPLAGRGWREAPGEGPFHPRKRSSASNRWRPSGQAFRKPRHITLVFSSPATSYSAASWR